MKVEKNEVENNENRQSGVHGKICEWDRNKNVKKKWKYDFQESEIKDRLGNLLDALELI